MSTNLPPSGPPSGPPGGPPWGTPSGPPPSGPPAGAAEVLEQGSGGPLPPVPPTQSAGGGGRRTGLIIGGVIGALALGGGAFAAYSWFTGAGPQPAEALPADTLGYVSIDFDPSNEQKLKLYNTLKKFPTLEKWFDEQGLEAGDDLKKKLFDAMQKDGLCEDLDYADDIEPWLGDRFAIAAFGQGERKAPAPVGVLQVKDADAAAEGIDKLAKCESDGLGEGESGSEDSSDGAGWVIEGDWLVVAETAELAQQVVDDTEKGSLADDEGFQTWTDAAGDSGFLTAYASEDAGTFIAEAMMEDFAGLGGIAPDGGTMDDEYTDAEMDAMADMMKGFEGGALTMRADDGSLELELAADTQAMGLDKLTSSDRGGEAIESLPENTDIAYGVGLEAGWADQLLDYFAEAYGEELDLDQLLAQAEQEMGLSLPDDLETLLGESAVLAVGDIDPEALFNSESGVDEMPVGLKVKGDPEAVREVLDKLERTLPDAEMAQILESDSEGDFIAVGPSSDYRKELLKDGALGDSDLYQDVVPDVDPSSVMFINADIFDGAMKDLGVADQLLENLERLGALGITTWEDDGVGHGVIRVTTD